MTQRIGIFGGTFDPVHYGHIASGKALVSELLLDKLYFMPCQQHPHHKYPSASPEQRVKMLTLALSNKVINEAQLYIDDRELKREGLSYTVDSLQEIRSELGDNTVIIFILGADAFASLHQWERWQSLLSLANLAVIERAGQIRAEQINEPVLKHLLAQSVSEINAANGELVQLELEPYNISSTDLRLIFASREASAAQKKMIDDYVPSSVVQYIEDQQLYRSSS